MVFMISTIKNIEIVTSTKPGLSSMGVKSRTDLLSMLSKNFPHVVITIINSKSDLDDLVQRRPDLVFLGMKFIPVDPDLGFEDTNKIWISKYLEDNGIAYTGSVSSAHNLELNKPLAKQRIIKAGLKTAKYFVSRRDVQINESDISLNYPLFVKPTDRGGGLGIDSDSVVHDFKQLSSRIDWITENIRSDSLIEEYLPGREISVAIIKNEVTGDYMALPIERVVPLNKDGNRILSPDIKHADAGLSIAVTDAEVKGKVSTLALQAFHALGARDYGRIDTRMDKDGTPHFLEANLIPSLVEGNGNFPKACVLNLGLNYEPMILSLIRLALKNKKIFVGSSYDETKDLTLVPIS